jgi:3-deoxy-D-manno-octulosonic-acid transferase
MIWIFYELLFWIGLVLASPYYLRRMIKRGGYAADFMERFGSFAPGKFNSLQGRPPVWIHAVSVGEVNLALKVIAGLRSDHPDLPIVLSTTTSTGHALATGNLKNVPVFYYPLDSFLCFSRVHRLLRPAGLILMEAELWPHHLDWCARHRHPVALINARISQRTLPRYLRFRFLLRRAFSNFRLITVQSASDLKVLPRLGFQSSAIKDVGSLKYHLPPQQDSLRRKSLLDDLSGWQGLPLLVGGSTFAGEEEILVDILMSLRRTMPDLRLCLAPRHVERVPEIESMLQTKSIKWIKRSQLSRNQSTTPGPRNSPVPEVLLIDSTGELIFVYELAMVIFMGKSLTSSGGQNIIEPAAVGRPVVFGPHMQNFENIAAAFLCQQAAVQVRDANELQNAIRKLLSDPLFRKELVQNSQKVIEANRHNFDRTLQLLKVFCGIERKNEQSDIS